MWWVIQFKSLSHHLGTLQNERYKMNAFKMKINRREMKIFQMNHKIEAIWHFEVRKVREETKIWYKYHTEMPMWSIVRLTLNFMVITGKT